MTVKKCKNPIFTSITQSLYYYVWKRALRDSPKQWLDPYRSHSLITAKPYKTNGLNLGIFDGHVNATESSAPK